MDTFIEFHSDSAVMFIHRDKIARVGVNGGTCCLNLDDGSILKVDCSIEELRQKLNPVEPLLPVTLPQFKFKGGEAKVESR